MLGNARNIVMWITLLAALVPVCRADAVQTIAGAQKGAFFHPQFQRWRIVKTARVPLMKVPVDAAGIPTILLGRYLYLGDGYITMPDVNSDGDRFLGACFARTTKGLLVQPAFDRDRRPGNEVLLRSAPGKRLLLTFSGVFELTLARQEITDGGDQQRRFDMYFNGLLADRPPGEKTPCNLHPVTLARRPAE